MLKLKDISNVENIKNESDFYIKIKIGFENWYKTSDSICYWTNGGGPQKTLIEIRLLKHSGAICAFTIVTMPEVNYKEAPQPSKKVVEKIGLPVFDISLWQEDGYYFGEQSSNAKDFDVCVEGESVSILLLSNEIVLKVINGPIVFGFDKNNILCSIQMMGMKLNDEGFLEKNIVMIS